MNVSLRPLEDRDLDTIFQQVTDPESIRMAAFTAEDQTDRRAFLDRTSRLRADKSVLHLVIDVDGAAAGTIGFFRIDDQPEVTYWVGRTYWGKGIASAALQILLAEIAERPLFARAASVASYYPGRGHRQALSTLRTPWVAAGPPQPFSAA